MNRKLLPALLLALAFLPVLLLRAQTSGGGSPHGALAIDCNQCHSAERWTPVLRTPAFKHETTGFPLEAAHASASCRSCHRSLVFNRVGTACADCHKDPHRGELGARCEACHTPKTWSNQREMFKVHDRTRFPLFSVHATLDCAACHKGQRPFEYVNTPIECSSCHASTFDTTKDPRHVAAGFERRCEDCHKVASRTWRETNYKHPATFGLHGSHASVACSRCHTTTFRGTPRDCVGCHRSDFMNTRQPNHVAAGYPLQCSSCHRDTSWRPASGVDHARTRFPLTGAHQTVECAQCHVNNRFAGTPTDCFSCHQTQYSATSNPNHTAAGFSNRCETCHSTDGWRPAQVDHNRTGFPLTGAHVPVACATCHVNNRFAGTPKDCYACHEAKYRSATNPSHSGFPTSCQTCHSTGAWRPASFDHSSTGFPLTGAHQGLDCTRCHQNNRYAGTPKDCYSCHQNDYKSANNPSHNGFPTTCQTCHSTNAWRPAKFDHNQTSFPLTGAHQRVDCAQCHKNGKYAGTPKDCYSCHQADYNRTTNPNHNAAGFPTQCLNCHTTKAWQPATFDHDGAFFPIYSGTHKGKWTSCGDCHKNSNNYKAFECILCHAHNDKAKVDNKHKDVNGYAYSSPACYRCHPTGRAGD